MGRTDTAAFTVPRRFGLQAVRGCARAVKCLQTGPGLSSKKATCNKSQMSLWSMYRYSSSLSFESLSNVKTPEEIQKILLINVDICA